MCVLGVRNGVGWFLRCVSVGSYVGGCVVCENGVAAPLSALSWC
jgi:hypothetical protein